MYEVNYNGRIDVTMWAFISTVVFDRKDCYIMLSAIC